MAKGDVGLRQEGVLGFMDFPRDVTAQTRETAYGAYNELVKTKIKLIAFNFDATDYMNSAGIGLVISLVEDATQAGRKVFAYGLGSHYRKLFSMVGLTERITLVADEHEAKQKAETAAAAEAAPAAPAPSAPAAPSADGKTVTPSGDKPPVDNKLAGETKTP